MTEDQALEIGLRNTYLRGFREAVSGGGGPLTEDILRRHPESAWAKGYEQGQAALLEAEACALRHVDAVMSSPFRAQAVANATVKVWPR